MQAESEDDNHLGHVSAENSVLIGLQWDSGIDGRRLDGSIVWLVS